jgi:hypothetical protein
VDAEADADAGLDVASDAAVAFAGAVARLRGVPETGDASVTTQVRVVAVTRVIRMVG